MVRGHAPSSRRERNEAVCIEWEGPKKVGEQGEIGRARYRGMITMGDHEKEQDFGGGEATHGRAEGVAGDKHGDNSQAVCFWNGGEQKEEEVEERKRDVGWWWWW